jgi:glycosyltransferase involved in cell wall biosynthesis
LQSLAQQSRPADEVLIWDDHSPQDPSGVINEFYARFSRLKYHRNQGNLGMPGNLNAVIREARGDLIANLHDADLYHPQLLELWERAIVSHPSAGLAFCGLDDKTLSPAGGRMWVHPYKEVTPGREFFEQAFVGQSSSPIWGTVMVRREVYERHLPFDERFGPWADVDMWMRVCDSHDIAYVARPLIMLNPESHFRRHFQWDTIHLLLSMHLLNIHRMAHTSEELGYWLLRQRWHASKTLARLFLGRLVKLEARQLVKGLRMSRLWIELLRGTRPIRPRSA